MAYKTSNNNYGTAKWIVDSVPGQGTHITITSALTDASSGETIFIRPGTYTENLTLKAGVNLSAFVCDPWTPNVTIIGKMTATYSGTVSISGITLQTNGDYVIESTGSSSTILYLTNININMTNFSGFRSTNANFVLRLYSCRGDKSTTGVKLVSMTDGAVGINYSSFTNSGSSVTPEDISGGSLSGSFFTLANGVNCSSTGLVNFTYVSFSCPSGVVPLTSTSSSISVLTFCNLPVGGGVAAINTTGSGAIRLWGCNNIESSAADAITGTGTVVYDLLSSGNVNSTIDSALTTTERRIFTGSIDLASNVRISSGSGSPNGSVSAPKGSLYLRTDGSSTSTRAYINNNGGTGWSAITTAS